MTAAALAPSLPLALVALVLVGAASVAFMSQSNATLQMRAAPEMRGRVMALWFVSFQGSTPIGGPIVGAVMGAYGARGRARPRRGRLLRRRIRWVAGAALAAQPPRGRPCHAGAVSCRYLGAVSSSYAGTAGVCTLTIRQGSSASSVIANVQRSVKPDQARRAAAQHAGRVAVLDVTATPQVDVDRHRRRLRGGVERDDPDPLHLRAANDQPAAAARVAGVQHLTDRVGRGQSSAAGHRSRRWLPPRRRPLAERRPRGCPARSVRPRGSGQAQRRARRR